MTELSIVTLILSILNLILIIVVCYKMNRELTLKILLSPFMAIIAGIAITLIIPIVAIEVIWEIIRI